MQVIEVIIKASRFPRYISQRNNRVLGIVDSIRVNFDFFLIRVIVNMLFINVCMVEQRVIFACE